MKELADDLVNKYNSRDPILIAEKLGIIITFEDLGQLAGYFNKAFDKKFIHLSTKIPNYKYPHLASVLLYYAIKDEEYYIIYVKVKDRIEYSTFERAANIFAITLLDTKNEILNFISFDQLVDTYKLSDTEVDQLHDWLNMMTNNIDYHKYTGIKELDQILYVMDKIEDKT